ncbi:MAG TPA: DoxX family protein [Steroidobacteraceae bacterium]|nr:DoxX family protein [Steroidobacteraceae bacterium]
MQPFALLAQLPADRLRRFGRKAILWAVTLFLMQAFVPSGYFKLLDNSGWTEAFAGWGYSESFRRAVGVAEIIAGLVILVPRVASYGALLMFMIMVGAIGTHFRFAEYMDAYTSELPSLCFSAALVFARWPFRAATAANGR